MFNQKSNPVCVLYRESKRRFLLLYHILGYRFLSVAILVEHILQAFVAGGGAGGLIGVPIVLLLSRSGLPATRIQILETVAISAWQLKPLIGILSDAIYLGGHNKSPYMIATCFMGIVSSVLIVGLYPVSPYHFTVLLFFVFLPIATTDLLLEARYVEKTACSAESRPTLYSFIQFGSCFWQLMALILMGVAIHFHLPLEWFYMAPILPLTLISLLLFRDWLGERPRQPADKDVLTNILGSFAWYRGDIPLFGIDTIKIRKNWRIFLLALLIGSISLLTSALGLLELSTSYLFGASLASASVMVCAFFLLLDRRVAKLLTFVVIQNVCSVSLRAATFFFYTDPIEAYPQGPHFSREFYVSVMGAVGILLALIGVVTYDVFMIRWSYRKVFLVTGVFYIVTLLPNILLYRRLNVSLGIPDTVFVLGADVLQTIVGVWNTMPYGILMLSLCQHGMEASTYAILAGTSNLCSAFSAYQGAFLLDKLHIKPSGNISGEGEQFDNLWIASTINILLQVVPLFFIPFLVPDALQTDDLLHEEPIRIQDTATIPTYSLSLTDEEIEMLDESY